MNAYKIQYWLYACLNTMYGNEVKIKRDSLHSIYHVNKHGFEVSTKTMPIKKVRDGLIEKLLNSNYEKEVATVFTAYRLIRLKKVDDKINIIKKNIMESPLTLR